MNKMINNKTDLIAVVDENILYINRCRARGEVPFKIILETTCQGNFDVEQVVENMNAKISGLSIATVGSDRYFSTYGLSDISSNELGKKHTIIIKPIFLEYCLWLGKALKEGDIDLWFVVGASSSMILILSVFFPYATALVIAIVLVAFYHWGICTIKRFQG